MSEDMAEKKGYVKPQIKEIGYASHYKILGVPENSKLSIIKGAYHDAANRLHPDKTNKNRDKEEFLKLVNHSYSVLSDPEKRAQYDKDLPYLKNEWERKQNTKHQEEIDKQKAQERARKRREQAAREKAEKDVADRKAREAEIRKQAEEFSRQAKFRRKGQRLGEKLSHWVNSEQGKRLIQEDEIIMAQAVKRTTNWLERPFHSMDFYIEKARSAMEQLGEHGNFETSGSWVMGIAKALEDLLSKRFDGNRLKVRLRIHQLEERLREQNAAKKYDRTYDYYRDSSIPISTEFRGPDWRYDPNEELGGRNNDNIIYFKQGFKAGWERIKNLNQRGQATAKEDSWIKWEE